MRHLIVGAGVAGLAAAQAIRERDQNAEITLLGDEAHPPYFRAGLSEWMHGAISSQELHIRPRERLKALGITQILGRAEQLSTDRHELTLSDGRVLPWDKLLIATGARPFVPPWPGTELTGFHTYRTWEDCAAIKEAVLARPDLPAVIIGAGILGLEVAWDCRGLGVSPILLVRDPAVGLPIFEGRAAQILMRRLADDGVEVHLNEEVDHFEGVDGTLRTVVTNTGRRIECSAVVAAVGVHPNAKLVEATDIATERWIKVDAHLRTSHPHIYAAGDVATVFDPMLQAHSPTRTWEPSYLGGQTAGENMAGGSKQFIPCTMMNASLVYDLNYVLLGEFAAAGPDVEVITDSAPEGRYGYRALRLRDDRVVGATFIGDRRSYLAYRRLIQDRTRVTEVKDRLLHRDFDPNLALEAGGLNYYFF